MSKVKITRNASGTGTLTISAPNTNTDRTLTLPDGAGEILTDASTLPASQLTGTLPALDGSALTGIGGGKVLQTVSMHSETETSTTSTSFVDSVLTANITPSATTSKILILSTTSIYNSQNGWTTLTVNRNGTDNLGNGTWGLSWGKDYGTQWMSPAAINFMDSPGTTSSTTYTVQIRTQESGHTSYLNINGTRGTLILMEIGA